MRVLLVEDDPTTQQSVTMMLESAGMVVDATDLGEDGLEIGKLYDYDIIVLDLMLPDMETIVRTMMIHDAYPSKWELPPMDASSSETAVETITLTCSHVTQSA